MINITGSKTKNLKLEGIMKTNRKFDLLIYQSEINDEIFDAFNKL